MCNWWKPKPKDGNGTINPEKGILVFSEDIYRERIRPDLAPQWIRFIYDEGCNLNNAIHWISRFRSEGIRIYLNITHKKDIYKTPDLVIPFVQRFRDNIVYSMANEPNSNIAPAGEPNSYIKPNVYSDVLHTFHTIVKTYSPTALISVGDFNGLVKKNKDNDCMITEKYITELVKYGCLDLFNIWNFHTYLIDYRFYNVLNCMRKFAKEKPIVIGEFPARTKEEYKFFMTKFKLNNIASAIIFAWGDGDEWKIYDKPELISYIKNY